MNEKLLAELLKLQDNLQSAEFTIGKTDFKFYYRYLTLLEKVRIEQMSVKRVEVTQDDLSVKVTYEKQEHLIPIHTIIEKALDKDGKRIFSHTNPKDIEAVSKLPMGVASYIAYQMSLDIMGSFKGESDGN